MSQINNKIKSLTAEQESRMSEFRNKWIRVGLSTAPADRQRAEAAIRKSYILGGVPEPRKIVWCGSPFSQGITRSIILDKKIIDSVRASVGASVRASVWDSVRDSVRASVWDSVGASVRDSVWDSVRDSVWDSGYGQHDASWLSFYDYFGEVCGLHPKTERLAGLFELAQSCGWYLPHEGVCWVSERHHLLNRDEQGRLHSLTDPAVSYPDGWSIYAVHGVRVPQDIIEDRNSINPHRITSESNAEIRRVMLDIFGQARYLQESGAKKVQSDRFGELYRQELVDDEPIVMVRVTNSTPEPDGSVKPYFLRVPPEIRTAEQAVAWTFGKEPGAYAPAVET